MTEVDAVDGPGLERLCGPLTGYCDLLADLDEAGWDHPSLCAGWRVREVVAHMTMPTIPGGRRAARPSAR